MNKSEIIDRIAGQRDTLLGVSALRLFGSAARGGASEASDADFIVKFAALPTFDRYMDLKLHLEHVLGMRVDLVTEAAVRPELREAIERDAVRVA
ncbi:MAG: nucleotidyltransferase family protein [Hyphomicrobiales bacterium]